MQSMKQVAESQGVRVHCPDEGRFSLFNSPYPGHKLKSGIDIYPGIRFGGAAPSPVDGEVELVRKVKAPTGKGFEAAEHDTVVLIRPKDNEETVVKLLHVELEVSAGETVRVGEEIGSLLRSGYYGWGTSPHIHLEVRRPEDPLRARGGHPINVTADLGCVEPVDEIAGEVVWAQPEYSLIRLGHRGHGLTGSVNGAPGVLDGGIPYYGWLGLHTEKPRKGEITLLGKPIADVRELHEGASIADSRSFTLQADGAPTLGLSLYLTPGPSPIIKILPTKIGGLRYSVGDVAKVTLA
ncbi:hypothetical protein JXL21_13155 [Candidatus Bathyarchaeota archaeon]|nr:hypothetical protein [Candidatus Bathyarchaeota archaeon]